MRNPFVRKADAEAPATPSSARSEPASLPSILSAKLVSLAESGDVSAIKLLLEKDHLSADKPEPVLTLEEAQSQLRQQLC